jgi:hypothetical protein
MTVTTFHSNNVINLTKDITSPQVVSYSSTLYKGFLIDIIKTNLYEIHVPVVLDLDYNNPSIIFSSVGREGYLNISIAKRFISSHISQTLKSIKNFQMSAITSICIPGTQHINFNNVNSNWWQNDKYSSLYKYYRNNVFANPQEWEDPYLMHAESIKYFTLLNFDMDIWIKVVEYYSKYKGKY